MILLKHIRILWMFYKNIALLSILITGFCIRTFWHFGFESFFSIFWAKVITLTITVLLVDSLKKKEYFYYQNAGFSKSILWSIILVFDIALFLSAIVITHKLK